MTTIFSIDRIYKTYYNIIHKKRCWFFFFTLKAFLYIQTLYCFDFRETRTGLFFYINLNYYKNVIFFFCNFEEQKSCIEEKTDGILWKTTFAGRNEEIPCPENQKGRDIVIKIN